MFLTDFLFSILGVLLAVAFFTLMERKMMGVSHYRKGPNKTLIYGVSQPISDALKLLSKEMAKLSSYKMIMYYSGASLSITLMILCWMWYESLFSSNPSMVKIMVILSLMSMSAYSFMLMSWGSNSKYSVIGGHRSVAQIISYEVCLVIFLLVEIYTMKSYSFKTLMIMQEKLWFMLASLPLFMTWLMICMAEANRTPFDLAEGESEIVSGFNIEYGGGLFAFIFISEYGMILLLSFITSMYLMGGSGTLTKILVMSMIFIWVRSSFPRVRYNNLMMMCWKLALPYSLCMLMVFISV